MPPFIPGIELSRRFYQEAVRPLLDQHYPHLPHAAAHVGSGSDVLGYDTDMSTDHFWGPAVHLFLLESHFHLRDAISAMLSDELPFEIAGYSTHYDSGLSPDGIDLLTPVANRPIKHHVFIKTVRQFAQDVLQYDVNAALTPADWLSFPMQKLLEVTSGAVHHDGVGELTALREKLAWYPHDVWVYLLACGWTRISQEEHLMPRAGFTGDETGSALIGARLVRDVMLLCFLMEKQYVPYAKWFGTAFNRLQCAPQMTPHLQATLHAITWQQRETALSAAYVQLAKLHNALNLTKPMRETTTSFFNRPFQVMFGGDFAEALIAQITDPDMQRIAEKTRIGSIDQFSDSTDLRENMAHRAGVAGMYAVE